MENKSDSWNHQSATLPVSHPENATKVEQSSSKFPVPIPHRNWLLQRASGLCHRPQKELVQDTDALNGAVHGRKWARPKWGVDVMMSCHAWCFPMVLWEGAIKTWIGGAWVLRKTPDSNSRSVLAYHRVQNITLTNTLIRISCKLQTYLVGFREHGSSMFLLLMMLWPWQFEYSYFVGSSKCNRPKSRRPKKIRLIAFFDWTNICDCLMTVW